MSSACRCDLRTGTRSAIMSGPTCVRHDNAHAASTVPHQFIDALARAGRRRKKSAA
ncbi:hypothetical protein [Streptomyces hawaiiensis]|uniref:hypothetical protein n=1 Tax=Streptomyces hawaiiensis TaxID=67305 RepID=UPI003648EE15